MSTTSPSASPAQNQPSSILFFIAVAIGVVIALVFIFFSIRYYVRTKLGIYATARITTTNGNGLVLLTGDFAMQTFNSYNPDLNAHLRRARRRRFQKKRRLTEEEVNHLFPMRTYQDWLDGGAERDADNRDIHDLLKEENDQELTINENESQDAVIIENQDNNENQNEGETSKDPNNEKEKEKIVEEKVNDQKVEASSSNSIKPEVDLSNPFQEEFHFDSGSCAICIDTFEPSDLVRGLICGHVFHQECLDPWLIKRKACCPMCKRDYYLKKNNQNNDGETTGENGNGNGNEANDNENINENDNGDTDSIQYTQVQYTTLANRVQEILERNPEIDNIAKENMKKYLSLKWRIFWVIMGISRTDLINSAIVAEDQRQREAAAEAANNPNVNADAEQQNRIPEDDETGNSTTENNGNTNRNRVEVMV